VYIYVQHKNLVFGTAAAPRMRVHHGDDDVVVLMVPVRREPFEYAVDTREICKLCLTIVAMVVVFFYIVAVTWGW